MFSLDGALYRTCTWIYNFAFLNLLFLISCIPIITIFPASAAMFGVVRQMVKKNDISIFTKYRTYFVENFKQSFIIGLFATVIGLFLYADFRIIGQIHSSLSPIISVCLLILSFYFMLTLLSVFPLMVNAYYTTKQLLTNAFKFSMYKPHLTLLNLIALVVFFYVSLRFTFLLFFFTSSVSAYITYWFAERKFITLMPQADPVVEEQFDVQQNNSLNTLTEEH
jgi:uncharacterized membrane protein YesL